jgi:hypothetical protein
MIKGEAAMKQNIIYLGLEVDDTQYYGSALDITYLKNQTRCAHITVYQQIVKSTPTALTDPAPEVIHLHIANRLF